MKSLGIVRRIDSLGRVVLPKELRITLDIQDNDPIEMFTDDGGLIVLRKYSPAGDYAEQVRRLVKNIAADSALDPKTRGAVVDVLDKLIAELEATP